MKTISYIFRMLAHPRRTARELGAEVSIAPSLAFVLGLGIYYTVGFFIGYLTKSYPASPEKLQVFIETWGEFSQLPFLKIPPESYRLFLAFISIPMVLAGWMLMAGSARLLAMLFKGKASYEQYLNLLAFSFFNFWVLSAILDTIYSGFLDPYIVPALHNEYGPFWRAFFAQFPPWMYVVLFGLGGVYNGIVVHETERFSLWKTVIIAMITFAWPMILITTLAR